MRNILFVDDEKLVLDGLRRNLRSMRKEWNMVFAESGREALDCMEATAFDVIISDLRMPQMDGAEFLSNAKDRQPETLRIVLSGHAEEDLASRSARSAHRFLAKPCSSDDIKDVIGRAFELRARFESAALQRFAQKAELPPIPQLYTRLCEVTGRESATSEDAAEVVEQDVAMSAKVLQLVNSAFFGVGRQIDSIQQAVVLLGIDTLKSVVMSNELFGAAAGEQGIDLAAVSERSLQTARVAKVLARKLELGDAVTEQSMTASVLHDLGMLLLSNGHGADYGRLVDAHAGAALVAAERDAYSFSHEELGAYVLALWGIPDPVVEAVCFHHQPSKAGVHELSPLGVLHLSAFLVDEARGRAADLDERYLNGLNLPFSIADLQTAMGSVLGQNED